MGYENDKKKNTKKNIKIYSEMNHLNKIKFSVSLTILKLIKIGLHLKIIAISS